MKKAMKAEKVKAMKPFKAEKAMKAMKALKAMKAEKAKKTMIEDYKEAKRDEMKLHWAMEKAQSMAQDAALTYHKNGVEKVEQTWHLLTPKLKKAIGKWPF